MGKIKKFAQINIRKLTGGRDPVRVIEEFILRRGFDPDQSQKEKSLDVVRWMIALREDAELEVLLEGAKKSSETTIYMGINVLTVPIRGATDVLAAALEVADGLVGIKVSLVGHFLVLSASMGASSATVEELEYSLRLIEAQEGWFRDAIHSQLGIEAPLLE